MDTLESAMSGKVTQARITSLTVCAVILGAVASLLVSRVSCLLILSLVLASAFVTLRWRPILRWGGLALWVLALIVPVDVTFRNVPGPPRLVPYVIGLPSQAAVQSARQGDVVLGGCIRTGFEPLFILVW